MGSQRPVCQAPRRTRSQTLTGAAAEAQQDSSIRSTAVLPLTSFATIGNGLPLGDRSAGMNEGQAFGSAGTGTSGAGVEFGDLAGAGRGGSVTSYTITPPKRSRPMKAKVLEPKRARVTDTGSGPLSGPRLPSVLLSWLALKLATAPSALVRFPKS